MKNYNLHIILTFTVCLLANLSGFSQEDKLTSNSFETDFFTYTPTQKENVSDDHFSFAEFVISETKKALNNDVRNYNVIHYWNIISALDKLKVDKSVIIIAFQKMVELDGSCSYIINYKDKVSFNETIPALYEYYYSRCNQKKKLATN